MSVAVPTGPAKFWTRADLEQLPEEANWRCYEIVDGSLVVRPGPSIWHDAVGTRLLTLVGPQVPDGFEMIIGGTVDLDPSYLVSDLAVLRSSAIERNAGWLVSPADILLLVEVVSPSSRTMDRLVKPAKYAAAGIRSYWRVETNPLTLTAYVLPTGADVYSEVGTWGEGDIVRLTTPFAVDVALDRITR